ncbi:MAG: hypothetical protein LUF02_03475 [Erysipelotrichaceae bacterium]|nr:hypothetical protein [Erysipelotrichaceae bacterium]
MALKDKYENYKQRKEAQRYFRSNNDQFLDSSQWMKVILYGLLASIGIGVVLGLVIYYTPITSLWFYIITGYLVAMAITKASGVQCQQAGYASVVFTFLSYVFSIMTMYVLGYASIGFNIGLTGIISLIWPSIKYMFTSSIISIILMIVGLYEAYMVSK